MRHVGRGEARRLVEIGRDDLVWKGDIEFGPFSVGDVAGAIVKVNPPADVSAGALAELERRLRSLGAVAVRVTARPPATGPDTEVAVEVASAPRRSLREVVDAVREGMKSVSPDALKALVEEALGAGEQSSPKPVVPSTSAPLWPVKLTLTNWYRYRGEHEITLGASVYGIAARTEGNPERSNWQGKSSLLTAIPFALYGWHTHRTDDEWITRGEEAGEVRLELSDGSVVVRSRKRGKATQVSFIKPSRPVEGGLVMGAAYGGGVLSSGAQGAANQAAAAQVIAEHVGLTERDFFSVAFVRQKEVDQLVRAKPAERLELLTGWLELGVLRGAEDWVRGELDAESKREADVSARLASVERRVVDLLLARSIPVETPDEQVAGRLGDERLELERKAQVASERAAKLKGDVASLDAWMRDAATARRGEEAERKQAELAAELEGQNVAELDLEVERLRKVETEAGYALKQARGDLALKRQLAAGAFDGACPVGAMQCPATEQINGARTKNRKLLVAAEQAEGEARVRYDTAVRARAATSIKADELRTRFEVFSRLAVEVEQTRPARAVIEAQGWPPAPGELRAQAGQAWQAALDAAGAVRALEEAERAYRALVAERVKLHDEQRRHAHLAAILREGLAVVGRQGAQKAMAVSELARIEHDANGLLRACGIDLTVALRWGRESTTQLAPTCEACGMVFGSSSKVKVCGRCGAVRGPKIDPKVELELSDRSGAADDLGGLAVRIAAGSWLRARRGSAWRGLVVDEPFGALDASNRRALSSHLATVVRSGGFSQALIVAHDAASMSALPERLTVVGGRDGSRIEGGDAKREGPADLGQRDADVVGERDRTGDRRRRARRPAGAAGG